jgi:hypothetical protein
VTWNPVDDSHPGSMDFGQLPGLARLVVAHTRPVDRPALLARIFGDDDSVNQWGNLTGTSAQSIGREFTKAKVTASAPHAQFCYLVGIDVVDAPVSELALAVDDSVWGRTD